MGPLSTPHEPQSVIIPLGREHLGDAWGLINRCSKWLAAQGLTHWKNYYTEAIVGEKIDSGTVHGVYRGKALLGIVSLGYVTPQYIIDILRAAGLKASANSAYLSMLATEPGLHSKGLGSKLLVECEQICRRAELPAIHIGVLQSYKSLNEFYSKRGYELLVSAHDGDEQMNFYRKSLRANPSEIPA